MSYQLKTSSYAISPERFRALAEEYGGEVKFYPESGTAGISFTPQTIETEEGPFTLMPYDLSQRFIRALQSYKK